MRARRVDQSAEERQAVGGDDCAAGEANARRVGESAAGEASALQGLQVRSL